MELPLEESGFAGRGGADVFQGCLQVVEHGIEVRHGMLSHANKGILILVRLVEETLGAETLVAADKLLYHLMALKY